MVTRTVSIYFTGCLKTSFEKYNCSLLVYFTLYEVDSGRHTLFAATRNLVDERERANTSSALRTKKFPFGPSTL